MAEKCIWCAVKADTVHEIEFDLKNGKKEKAFVCSELCEQNFRNFIAYVQSHMIHFLVGLILPLFGLIPVFMGYTGFGLFVVFGLMAMTMLQYPFATPQTNAWLGIKKAITMTRIMAVVLILAGATMWLVIG